MDCWRLSQRGVRFLLNSPISSVVVRAGAIAAVRTSQADVEAEQFVLAMGAGSAALARSVGVDLPIYPLRGYSITLNAREQPGAAPKVSITDSTRKVVFARIGSRLRVAGMAELGGYDTAIAHKQIASLKQSTQTLFPDCSDSSELRPWAGLRPATPTALPMVGKHAKGPHNLLLNVGHGALGFTLAFGSAGRIARLLDKPAPRQMAAAVALRAC